jgi:endonuclease/exonuclease/phosphatase family metal-dependent hydrolase
MASNLTSGNAQSYDPGHGQRILQGLGADVVLMQEFNYGSNSVADIGGFVAATFGGVDAGFAWYRGSGGQIPNGVVSRWPIVASGDWVDPLVGNRAFTWAKIDLPGPRDLWVVSLHLLTSNAGDRASEARSLIAQFTSARIPATDFMLVGGDFNTGARTEQALTEFSARLVTTAPWPVDQAGNGGTNASRSKPYDWVLASPCLHRLQVPVAIGAQSFPSGLVFDSTVYTPLTDVPPVLFGDSNARNMQHMGVVRDFAIQP